MAAVRQIVQSIHCTEGCQWSVVRTELPPHDPTDDESIPDDELLELANERNAQAPLPAECSDHGMTITSATVALRVVEAD